MIVTSGNNISPGDSSKLPAGRTALRLCVIAPCYNEEDVIDSFYRELKVALEGLEDVESIILLVDDGSRDGTLACLNRIAAEDPQVRVCSLSRNFGHQIALSAGLDWAAGDAVILMDSDLQHPPSMIAEMVRRFREGDDVVLTVRQHTADATLFKRLSSNAFYWIFNRLSDVQLVCGAADFCLLSRRVYRALRGMPERHRFLRGLVAWAGFRRSTLPYASPPRAAGTSKYTLAKMLRLAGEAILSFSSRPIAVALQAGSVFLLAGLVYLVYILFGYFFRQDFVPGWSSMVCSILLVGGCQLLATGLLGVYIGRIFEQVKQRPVYLLKQSPRRLFERGRRGASEESPTVKAQAANVPKRLFHGTPTHEESIRKTA